MASDVRILIGRQELTRWRSYSIDSDLLATSDAFSFVAGNDDGALAGVAHKGDRCKVLIDGDVEMQGHVDDVEYDGDASGETVTITGRDDGAWLSDCSAKPLSMAKPSLLELAAKLTEGQIDTWTAAVELELTENVKVQPGEKVEDVLRRYARKLNVLIWLAADGAGRIGRPNYYQPAAAALYRYLASDPRAASNNVIQRKVRESWRDQHSPITMHGVRGNTTRIGGRHAHSTCQAIDPELSIDRPLVMSEGNVKSKAEGQRMADREVARRRFEATTLEYSVRGFYGTPPAGGERTRFAIDTMIDVVDAPAGRTGSYWCSRRTFTGGTEGQLTQLKLHPAGIWLA